MTRAHILAAARDQGIIDFRDADDDPHVAALLDDLEAIVARLQASDAELLARCRQVIAALLDPVFPRTQALALLDALDARLGVPK